MAITMTVAVTAKTGVPVAAMRTRVSNALKHVTDHLQRQSDQWFTTVTTTLATNTWTIVGTESAHVPAADAFERATAAVDHIMTHLQGRGWFNSYTHTKAINSAVGRMKYQTAATFQTFAIPHCTIENLDSDLENHVWDQTATDTTGQRFTLVEGSLDITGTEVNDAYIQFDSPTNAALMALQSTPFDTDRFIKVRTANNVTTLATLVIGASGYRSNYRRVRIKKIYAGDTESGNTTLATLNATLTDNTAYKLVAHDAYHYFRLYNESAAVDTAMTDLHVNDRIQIGSQEFDLTSDWDNTAKRVLLGSGLSATIADNTLFTLTKETDLGRLTYQDYANFPNNQSGTPAFNSFYNYSNAGFHYLLFRGLDLDTFQRIQTVRAGQILEIGSSRFEARTTFDSGTQTIQVSSRPVNLSFGSMYDVYHIATLSQFIYKIATSFGLPDFTLRGDAGSQVFFATNVRDRAYLQQFEGINNQNKIRVDTTTGTETEKYTVNGQWLFSFQEVLLTGTLADAIDMLTAGTSYDVSVE